MAISRVEDEAVRDILNREFQARSAVASSLADLKAVYERLASMRSTAEKVAKIEENDVPGTAVALVSDGEVAWSAGYGLANRELPTVEESLSGNNGGWLVHHPPRPGSLLGRRNARRALVHR